MYIEGHAFKENEQEIRQKRRDRYKEIQHLSPSMEIKKESTYGRNNFRGTLKTDELKALSEEDITLICDHGNLCFGGNCTKSGDTFTGCYYTD